MPRALRSLSIGLLLPFLPIQGEAAPAHSSKSGERLREPQPPGDAAFDLRAQPLEPAFLRWLGSRLMTVDDADGSLRREDGRPLSVTEIGELLLEYARSRAESRERERRGIPHDRVRADAAQAGDPEAQEDSEDPLGLLSRLSQQAPDARFLSQAYDGMSIPNALPSVPTSQKDVLSTMEWVYTTEDTNKLQALFEMQQDFLKQRPALYRETLAQVYTYNDNVDLRELQAKPMLTEKDQARLAIRILARSILRMGELDAGGDRLLAMGHKLGELPDAEYGWNFHREFYSAMAKSAPDRLLGLIRQRLSQGLSSHGGLLIRDPEEAALSLLREGRPVGQDLLQALLRSSGGGRPSSLLYYVDDPRLKSEYIGRALRELEGKPDMQRCWREPDLINALASYPEGRERLRKMRDSGRIAYIRVGGVYFGSLAGAVSMKELRAQRPALQQAAAYISEANRRFGGPEKTAFVDIRDRVGDRLHEAGWGANSLFMTRGMLLENTPRAAAFILAHEACEQRSTQGFLNSEFGRSYIQAFRTGALEDLRLGRRIGGRYVETGYGHPQDSEREWLAESASAVIIGEGLPARARPALEAAQRLFRH